MRSPRSWVTPSSCRWSLLVELQKWRLSSVGKVSCLDAVCEEAFAGFEGFEITWQKNVFDGAAKPRREVAFFGTHGVNFRASKPTDPGLGALA